MAGERRPRRAAYDVGVVPSPVIRTLAVILSGSFDRRPRDRAP